MSLFAFAASRRRGIIFVGLLVALLLVAGVAWHARATTGTSAAATASAEGKTDAAASDEASGTDILLGLAQTAMSEHRLVAPAGSNAYEFYLSVLQLDPQNRMARDNLRTAFADACSEVERTINARDLDEAQRELALLRDYDGNNYTLALLGGKLGAQRMVMTREHEAQAAIIQAQAEAVEETR
jgi:periplasmic protein TonB